MEKNNIFERLRNGDAVNMNHEEYQEAINEMQRSTQLCARISTLTQFREGTENWVNQLLSEPMGEDSCITPPLMVDFGNQVKIGKHVFINHSLTMMSAGGVTIDDNVMIGPEVKILTDNHDLHNHWILKCQPVHICKNALIGGGAIIQPGVTIGENAIVEAGAVVGHDVAPNTIVSGNPAKVIGKIY
ncbi:MAG: DapH/DapD/GlmU-related protein [Prevotella sp.]|jgi:acetyltransferase-like isoleucine patch superfamily enzyme